MRWERLQHRVVFYSIIDRDETDYQHQHIDKCIFFSDIQETNRTRSRALENAIQANS